MALRKLDVQSLVALSTAYVLKGRHWRYVKCYLSVEVALKLGWRCN